jgi:peroxiredoxin
MRQKEADRNMQNKKASFLDLVKKRQSCRKYDDKPVSREALERCVFVIDTKGVLAHVQIVPEIIQEPDYQKVLESVQSCS